METPETKTNKKDWVARPTSFMKAWGAPLIVLFSTNFIPMPYWLATLVIAATFVWMGIGCLINSRRCHRRHCYYSGPLFLIGAVLILIFGFGLLRFGQDDLNFIIWGTMTAALLTFIPELIWGKYKDDKGK